MGAQGRTPLRESVPIGAGHPPSKESLPDGVEGGGGKAAPGKIPGPPVLPQQAPEGGDGEGLDVHVLQWQMRDAIKQLDEVMRQSQGKRLPPKQAKAKLEKIRQTISALKLRLQEYTGNNASVEASDRPGARRARLPSLCASLGAATERKKAEGGRPASAERRPSRGGYAAPQGLLRQQRGVPGPPTRNVGGEATVLPVPLVAGGGATAATSASGVEGDPRPRLTSAFAAAAAESATMTGQAAKARTLAST